MATGIGRAGTAGSATRAAAADAVEAAGCVLGGAELADGGSDPAGGPGAGIAPVTPACGVETPLAIGSRADGRNARATRWSSDGRGNASAGGGGSALSADSAWVGSGSGTSGSRIGSGPATRWSRTGPVDAGVAATVAAAGRRRTGSLDGGACSTVAAAGLRRTGSTIVVDGCRGAPVRSIRTGPSVAAGPLAGTEAATPPARLSRTGPGADVRPGAVADVVSAADVAAAVDGVRAGGNAAAGSAPSHGGETAGAGYGAGASAGDFTSGVRVTPVSFIDEVRGFAGGIEAGADGAGVASSGTLAVCVDASDGSSAMPGGGVAGSGAGVRASSSARIAIDGCVCGAVASGLGSERPTTRVSSAGGRGSPGVTVWASLKSAMGADGTLGS
jgi:hypothetical protein